MKAERIESNLHPRRWSLNRPSELPARQVVLLTDGAGEAETETDRFAIGAPAILWLGGLKGARLGTAAGATGYRGSISDAMALAAIGDQPESVSLRYLIDRDFVLSLAGHADQASVIERCFAGMVSELRQQQDGSALLVSALLRIVLATIYRLSGGEIVALPGIGEKASLLRRFRQLVEMNFRSHWTVAQYASALGISADRLHSICTRGIGKPPKALISERLAREAALRLERSSLTVEQLGHSLGFNDPAHFSNFFRKVFAMSPGVYRKAAADAKLGLGLTQPRSFADWP
jgi:AraC family transcriptional activator of pobA